MTIRIRRIHQYPWLGAMIAYESIDDEHVKYAIEAIPSEFIRDSLGKYGRAAVRKYFDYVKSELVAKLESDDAPVIHISEVVGVPSFTARSQEEWQRLFGVNDG